MSEILDPVDHALALAASEFITTTPYKPAQLLKRALENARPRYGYTYRWAIVRDLLGVGSTSAKELCRWAGLDPYEYINPSGRCKMSLIERWKPGGKQEPVYG